MNLEYEPTSEPLHNSAKWLFLNRERQKRHKGAMAKYVEWQLPMAEVHIPRVAKMSQETSHIKYHRNY